jgi:sec-independent protein translocase protein TatB
MIEISIWKIFLVIMVALIVLGPEQLPKAANMLGKWLGKVRGSLKQVEKQLTLMEQESQKETEEATDRK